MAPYSACGSAIVHVVIYYGAAPLSAIVLAVIFHRRCACGAGSDLCHELKERIGYNYSMGICIEKRIEMII